MKTEFGKWSGKLRIDNNELLADMAKRLNVTPSFLSAVENGKRNIPKAWYELLVEAYDLDASDTTELNNAIMHSVTQIKMNIKGMPGEEQSIVYAFARRFPSLDDDTKKRIGDILNGE